MREEKRKRNPEPSLRILQDEQAGCVCICAVCVCFCIYVYIYVCVHIWVCVCVYMWVCAHVLLNELISTNASVDSSQSSENILNDGKIIGLSGELPEEATVKGTSQFECLCLVNYLPTQDASVPMRAATLGLTVQPPVAVHVWTLLATWLSSLAVSSLPACQVLQHPRQPPTSWE